ncbi:hypothetical protein DL96DRAFT_207935 [Flagelloscypha sp. PMI_526]|nr:hypothetical protein DL96DRAFT_207935 [Flagelloscypha sp. PMI_526]
MLTSNSTPCEEQLRSEINRLTEERRSYASQLNHTLPIFRLAPDTLCLIFQFYKQDALDEHIKTSTHYLYSWNSSVPRLSGRPWCYVPWVAVSHVCRRFRGIALEFASFWDTLCATSVPWTRELIRRSKQAPLHVCYLRTLSPIGDTINQG